MRVVGAGVPNMKGAGGDGGEPGGEVGLGGRGGEAVGADLEGGFVGGGEDGGGDAPFGFAGVRGWGEVAVADVAAARRAEEALRGCQGRVNVACEGGLYRGWRDKLRLDALGQGGVEAAESAMGGAADAAVAEVDGEREGRGGHGDGEVHRLAVALRGQRLVRRRELVGEMEVGGHVFCSVQNYFKSLFRGGRRKLREDRILMIGWQRPPHSGSSPSGRPCGQELGLDGQQQSHTQRIAPTHLVFAALDTGHASCSQTPIMPSAEKSFASEPNTSIGARNPSSLRRANLS